MSHRALVNHKTAFIWAFDAVSTDFVNIFYKY